jgi:hypothetical protein
VSRHKGTELKLQHRGRPAWVSDGLLSFFLNSLLHRFVRSVRNLSFQHLTAADPYEKTAIELLVAAVHFNALDAVASLVL